MIIKKFVVFEGIDGSGTSTQIELLKKRTKGMKFDFSAEPTESETGVFLRRILSGAAKVSAQTQAFLFAADRAEHVWGKGGTPGIDGLSSAGGVVQKTNDGYVCVSDRYLFSSLAYQGVSCGEELPRLLNSVFPLPELLFYFKLSVQTSLKRIDSRGDQKEIFESEDYLNSTALRYEKIIQEYKNKADSGMRIVEIDATLPKEKISEIIWNEIQKIL